MASKRRNMFYKNKTQETTEKGRSNIWPGAFAFSTGLRSDTIYMGNGVKFRKGGISPPLFDWCVQCQYPVGPDVMEAVEPTVEMEEEWRRQEEEKRKVKPPDDRGEGEGGEGAPRGEAEEEEVEDEDD
ncbi:hypothetical protein AAG570_001316 [Ranatra chinensis]|uniref:Uncharacterized protein n=1 Tax=Ranatra chinensis TaxID=642074 RepID=A0ABD0YN72_9HEMI